MTVTGIHTIIWDLDNTLYRRNPQLQKELREAEISVICAHTGWSRDKAQKEFNLIHTSVFQSATEASAHLSHIPIPQAAKECETYFNRIKFLKKDDSLINLFGKLSSYQHFMLTNGVIQTATLAIAALGLNLSQFTEIVTSEQTGANKPDPAGLLYILHKTGKPAHEHLMIGDRDSVDIAPAKKLGMKTCFVWGQSQLADVSVETVYDVAQILA
jgi:HAD superfamily hydrolase (TIGR01549 family)